jgi:hypothetical protein
MSHAPFGCSGHHAVLWLASLHVAVCPPTTSCNEGKDWCTHHIERVYGICAHLVLPEWRQPDAARIPVAILQGGRRAVRHQEGGLVDSVCIGVCGPGAQATRTQQQKCTRSRRHIVSM